METNIKEFIEEYIRTMTKAQIEDFKECAKQLNGNDDIVEMLGTYNYHDIVKLNILNLEEIQLVDLIVEEVTYMKEDDIEEVEKDELTILNEIISNKGVTPIRRVYKEKDKWYLDKEIERTNRIRTREFDTFEEIKGYIERFY